MSDDLLRRVAELRGGELAPDRDAVLTLLAQRVLALEARLDDQEEQRPPYDGL